MPSEHLLSIRNATVYRGHTRVFGRLSLDLRLGQSVAILGPNGAGKTTLMKLLFREIYPVASPGSWVRVLGRQRWHVDELRSHLGVVSPDLQHSYQRDVLGLEVVLSGFYASVGTYRHQSFTGEQRKRALALLEQLGASALGVRPMAELSTGEQRRLLLSRALVHDPHTLLLDEPLSGLDLSAAFGLLASLRELLRRGKTLVLVTHRVEEIPPEVERVVLLRSGSVFADGSKHATLTSEALSALYETPVRVTRSNGYFHATPG